jgi:hypothetical protein
MEYIETEKPMNYLIKVESKVLAALPSNFLHPYLVLIQKVVISCWCFSVGRPFLADTLVIKSYENEFAG